MLVLTIVTALGGFALGAYLTDRYAPPVARIPGSAAIGVVICVLVGAACGLACMHTYKMIHDFVSGSGIGNGLGGGGGPSASADAETLAGTAISIATQSGVLLALAVTAFLLTPAHARSER